MRQLDVVFVTPGNLTHVYQYLGKEHAIEPPVFVAYFAEYLRRKDVAVDIIDPVVHHLSDRAVALLIEGMKPRLVVCAVYGFQPSASTQNMPAARSLCAEIKENAPTTPILMIGTHPAALPLRTLEEEPVDFVCDGEGPITIYKLVQALRVGSTSFSEVPGLCYWEEDSSGARKMFHTPPAPNVTNLDAEMPSGAWDLLPMKQYIAHDWHTEYAPFTERTPYASIITSFGCPFKCEFCCIQAPFKAGEKALGVPESVNSYRFRSPALVVGEIAKLATKYSIRHFKIHDEMFFLNIRHVRAIAEGIRDQLGDSLNIWAYARVDTTKVELLDLLRSAGFRWLGIGIESASSTVRDGQDKSFTDSDIFRVVNHVHAAGIHVGANFIFGLPNDTLESMRATLGMAVEMNTVYANFYCAMAYPGSSLYLQAKRAGLSLPDDPGGPGWIGYSQHAYETLPLPTESLDAREVLAFRDNAWRLYYARPDYVRMIKEHLGETAFTTISTMTSQPPLRRKLFGDAPF